MLLSEVKETTTEKTPWWIKQASKEVLTLRDMFSTAQGYKLDFSPITHCPDMLYMYNDTNFKYPNDPKHQNEIDRINYILACRHTKSNPRNMLCSISENRVKDTKR